jgi:hypothetical protein
MPLRLILAVGLLFLSSLAVAEKKKTAADVLGGDEVVAVILKPDKVLVYRLKDQAHKEKPADYEASSGPSEVDVMTAQDLSAVVAAFDTYERNSAKGCKPIYGLRTTFVRGKDEVDVVYCFACDIITVYLNGKRVGYGEFDPGHKQLVRLAQRMLPKDEEIKKLK